MATYDKKNDEKNSAQRNNCFWRKCQKILLVDTTAGQIQNGEQDILPSVPNSWVSWICLVYVQTYLQKCLAKKYGR